MATLVKRLNTLGNVANVVQKVAYIKDYKTVGTAGGAIAGTGSFFARTLNTVEGDTSIVSLTNGTTGLDGTANRFILQAGTYHISVKMPIGQLNGNDPQFTKLRLYNITDSTTAINGGSCRIGDADVSLYTSFEYSFEGVVTLTSAKTFEVQYRCSNVAGSNTSILGMPANLIENELYTQVKITKIETLDEAY
jgi:hypothetical protein